MAAPSGIPADRYRDAPRPEAKQYQFKDAVSATIRTTAFMGGIGLFVSSVQNTLTKQNVTAWSVVTRFGGTTATFGKIESYQGIKRRS
jgi:hypothetical protein